MSRNSQTKVLPPHERNRVKTEGKLREALDRLVALGGRVSIAAIARGAGISAPLIHNKYPDFKAEVEKKIGRNPRSQLASSRRELDKLVACNKGLREEVAQLKNENRKLASRAESLRLRLATAESIAASSNVSSIGGNKKPGEPIG